MLLTNLTNHCLSDTKAPDLAIEGFFFLIAIFQTLG